MKRILLLLWLMVLPAFPASFQVTQELIFTNTAGTTNGMTFTEGTDTRTFTNNVVLAAAQCLTNTSPTASAGNLYSNLVAYPLSAALSVAWDGGTNITIVGIVSSNLVGSAAQLSGGGLFGQVTNTATNTVSQSTIVTVPMQDMPVLSTATNMASLLATNLGVFSTNSLPTNSTLMQNFMDLWNTATVAGAKFFTGANTHSNASQLWDYGTISNATIQSFTNTDIAHLNGSWTNDGSGTGMSSAGQLYLPGINVTGGIGLFTNASDPIMFYQTSGSGVSESVFTFDGSSYWLQLVKSNTFVIENGLTVPWFRITNNNGGIYMGGNLNVASNITGTVTSSLITNNTINGNSFGGTNNWGGDVAYSQASITSLANGNNTLNPGTNVFVVVSGPSAAFSIASITNGRSGRILTIENATGQTMSILNDSGFDGTAANRIYTGTSNTVSITGSAGAPGMANLIYDPAATHWVLQSITTTNIVSPSFTYTSFTNGALGAATAFNTYYTNTFGVRIKVKFQCQFTDQVGTASQVGMYQFSPNSSDTEPPIYLGYPAGVATIATNYFVTELGAGDYVAFTNTIGTAAALTNRVQY